MRSTTSAYSLLWWVRPERGASVRAAGARLRRGARDARSSRPTSATVVAWLRLRAGEWEEAERADAARDRERHRRPAARQDGSGRAGRPPRRSGCRRAAGRARSAGRPHRRAAADRAGARARDRVGADQRRADADRAVREARRDADRAALAPAGSRCAWRRGPPSPGSSSTSPRRCRRRTPRWLRRDWLGAADAFGDVGLDATTGR